MEQLGKIFSIGYQQRSASEFLNLVNEAEVDIVIDVRETPWSYRREFAKKALLNQLDEIGIDYFHAKFAGNPKEIRRAASNYTECLNVYKEHLYSNPEIVNEFDKVIGSMVREGKNICLVCYERHPEDCHRNVVLNSWLEFSGLCPKIEHLGPDGCPRFT